MPGEAAQKGAMAKIKLIERRLSAKASFAKLAERYSEDPESAQRGGDLGWIKKGSSMAEFEELAFSLKPGATTPGMQSPFGFEIFRCVGKDADSVHILRILIRVTPSPADSAKAVKRLEVLRERIKAGEDFGELAKAWSDDDSTKAKGGDLGLLDVQELSPVLKEAIAALKPGEVSEPLRQDLTPSIYAYSLVKLLERIPAKRLTLEKDRDKIAEMAKARKFQEKLEDFLKGLRQKVYIETLPGG
jgi:peptidyl-prolyl cis-trans isomerase SurA